jgi:predicted transcriptional regulator
MLSRLLGIDLYSLVRATSDQPRSSPVESRAEHTLQSTTKISETHFAADAVKYAHSLCIQRTRLRHITHVLERFTGLIIPHSQGAIVPTREQHAFLVDAQGVDHGLVAREVEYEGTFGTLPFFDAASVGVKLVVEHRSS